ncbi:hypothetical protein CYLTODRAFT_495557 [Cylindrobasidium torrendii FP15055 ss-10]|uniref:Uncharacterized protein n=1 Tax=Cylindrobasidium torrendii FP15055 ss-10 TaxID=1314674 RepID=A0A0D7ATL0_9AGAR|nr:hypothetical protein CYLTODRAFT_495557 [Cylindrobasidium torrendii FP15055 ss-10]
MGRPRKYHTEEEKRLARKAWDASYYRRNEDKIKSKVQTAYRASRAQYERDHDLPPKYSATKPQPLTFPRRSTKTRPSRLEKELNVLKEQHVLWLSSIDHSPRQFLESTYRAVVAAATQDIGEKLAQAAYQQLTGPVDEVQATYFRLIELRGEGDASALKAKALHQKMCPSTEACVELWELSAEGIFPSALVDAYNNGGLAFQQW